MNTLKFGNAIGGINREIIYDTPTITAGNLDLIATKKFSNYDLLIFYHSNSATTTVFNVTIGKVITVDTLSFAEGYTVELGGDPDGQYIRVNYVDDDTFNIAVASDSFNRIVGIKF